MGVAVVVVGGALVGDVSAQFDNTLVYSTCTTENWASKLIHVITKQVRLSCVFQLGYTCVHV